MVIFLAIGLHACQTENKEQMSNTSKMYQKKDIIAPVAKKESHIISTHGDDREDNYYWMRLTDEQKTTEKLDTHTQEVVDYLNAENEYTNEMTAHLKTFQDTLLTRWSDVSSKQICLSRIVITDITISLDMKKAKNILYMLVRKEVWKPMKRSCSMSTNWLLNMNTMQ